MLSDSSRELQPQKGLQIKQDDKFFSRLMSKETSMANSSCRVYYGGASGAVPFMWESQPGTPKHPCSDTTLPPLTPPPSYHSSCKSKSMQKTSMKPTLLSFIFPRLTPRKNHASPSSSRSSTSSSSSFSSRSSSLHGSPSAPRNQKFQRRSYFSFSRSPVHNCIDDDDEEGLGSPTSTLCFGVKRRNLNEFGGCQSMVNMKKALLSIVSHGSGQGTAA
ncbi:hypothetical protein QUC31_005847 [Theobroma cacao]|uniref:Uncharacterized protein LOC18587408 n=2 Tax=Theobroma cacao TaxID=3641 RepID=A0AB32X294_THECC|nr:PREDICTED: uncharacterized protein LOC18587408 [Theobroma cacao]EOY20041.1 Uncharacterized protein TCM_045439 [Theobroma cacao]WRX11712.1 Protein of unknown function DUF688 - like 3 [Theobroma cacao]